ncbi:hypothetical protein [Hyphococcus sp.]|uniref:hypothetical protein n=1 Tax=Hyphococcus sp. TaxID=2038636 RepID=UPI003CCB9DB1
MVNSFVRFDQSFEIDSEGFLDEDTGWSGDITVVASGTGGVVSPDGPTHAIFEQTTGSGGLTGPFTRFDGYRSLDDDQSFTTTIKVYLDPGSWAAGEGFDYSVAANNQAGGHLRDFIFHVTQDTSTGDLLIGASNNTNFDPREDLENGNFGEVTSAGWYTFEHVFYDAGDDTLAVSLTVKDANGIVIFNEVLNEPTDVYSTDFGGNRYGWFTNIDVAGGIAVDNALLQTEDDNPVQVKDEGVIVATFDSVQDAKDALDSGALVATTAEISTTGLDDAFFYVAEGMSIQAAIDDAVAGDLIQVADGSYNESLTIDKEITLEGVDAGADGVPDVLLTPTGAHGVEITGDIDNGGAATVSISGFSVSGASGAGLRIASSTNLTLLDITNSAFSNNGTHGVGSGSGAFDLDAISITNSTFTDNGQGGSNGSGDIVLFGFHGDATLTDLTITSTATEATAVSARGDNAIQIAGFDPTTYDVDTPIGNVVLDNVTVDGWYHKPQVLVQGFTDVNGLSFTDVDLSGGTSWGDLLFIDPVSSPGTDTPGNPGYPGNYLLTGGANSLDLSGVTINSGSTDVLGVDSRIRGTDGDDDIIGTEANDLLNDSAEGGVDYGGDDNVSGEGGNDIIVGGLGNDTLDGGADYDTAAYAGAAGDFTIDADMDANGFITSFNGVTDNNAGDGDEGVDVLTNIEALSFSGGATVLTLAQKIQLFNGSNDLVGTFDSIKDAVDAASAGYTIKLAAGVHDSDDEQIVIDKDLTIIGAGKDATTVEAAFDTSTSGDGRGWFLVEDGVTLDVSGVTFDGAGYNIWQAFRHLGSGTFDEVAFTDIEYQETGSPYQGTAIAVFGASSDVNVTNSMFSDIGRIGVLYFGAGTTGDFLDNTYIGKGDGDFLDYALDISAGAEINVIGNTVSNNRGVATSDGSGSAAFLVSTFFGGGTDAFFADNILTDNSVGVFVGFNSTDASAVEFGSGNVMTGGLGARIIGDAVVNNLDLIDGDVDWDAGAGNNFLRGANEDDELSGGAGADTVLGGLGDDLGEGGADGDFLFGGFGNDTLDGGDGNDSVSGEAGRDVLIGGDGADTLHGFGSHDSLFGGAGADDLRGGVGKDLLGGAADNDVIRGFEGDDRLFGGGGADTLVGNEGDDSLVGGGGVDRLKGDAGDDTLNGRFGDDSVSGGAGDDLFEFRQGHGNDIFDDFTAGAGTDDVIQLLAFGASFDSFAEVIAAATDNGNHTTIDLGGGDSILLLNVVVADLHEDDFMFG